MRTATTYRTATDVPFMDVNHKQDDADKPERLRLEERLEERRVQLDVAGRLGPPRITSPPSLTSGRSASSAATPTAGGATSPLRTGSSSSATAARSAMMSEQSTT